jgi:predicted AAA+ superfamily ATPase
VEGERALDKQRAVVLMGPRRVGKTILVYHTIQSLLKGGHASGREILYLSLETPLYTGASLESLVTRQARAARGPGCGALQAHDHIQGLSHQPAWSSLP